MAISTPVYRLDQLQQGPISLDQTWAIWKNQYIEPAKAPLSVDQADAMQSGKLEWRYNLDDSSIRHASYYTRIEVEQIRDDYMIAMPTIYSAADVYLNGKLVYQQGQIAGKGHVEHPTREYGLIRLPSQKVSHLVIHNSSYSHRTGGLRSLPRIGLENILWKTEKRIVTVLSLMIGSTLLIGVFHLILFLYNPKEKINFWFGILCFFLALRSGSYGNPRIWFEMFGTIPFNLAFRLEYLATVLCVLCLSYYYHHIFPSLYHKRISNIASLILAPYLAMILFAPPALFTSYLFYFQQVALTLIATATVVLVRATLQGDRAAIPFSVSVMILLIGATVEIAFSMMGSVVSVSVYAIYLMVVAQAILLAYLNHRTLQDLRYYKEQTSQAYSEIQKMVFPHQLKLLQQGQKLETTMPTGKNRGIVICFDVILSSTLPEPVRKSLFEQVFTQCYELMQKAYEPENLIANGYRIKEVGDGFYCSIGFPFLPPSKLEPAHHSLHLAKQFMQIFDRVVRSMNVPNGCAIGIAEGNLEGFYPVSGILEYQLFGDGIVRANRFQEARRCLQLETGTHILILQESLQKALLNEDQGAFVAVDLDKGSYRIRDNAQENCFYYQTQSYGFTCELDKEADEQHSSQLPQSVGL
ncbi:7TM diverse intracellular signaling domain-containing protein [Pseudobacteriovorax antillogorgiicola]|uniref:7TM diverse intracellular signaling domain-containing protein n=1 Tax=Pseudobacteriovorax antillogorgiicola TaxID=1513793 RepID=UPI0010513C10|nr:7TM diverse intracellular signaling domain-containing protein [Pseudobacteriovorax antillogorgiicola]